MFQSPDRIFKTEQAASSLAPAPGGAPPLGPPSAPTAASPPTSGGTWEWVPSRPNTPSEVLYDEQDDKTELSGYYLEDGTFIEQTPDQMTFLGQ